MLWVLAAIGAVLLGPGLHHALAWRERRRFPPPGRLVDVDGFKAHVLRTGQGAPTVVLDSALAGSCLSWHSVQPGIAQFSEVLSYDRFGFGWSDPVATPRTLSHMAEELGAVLRASGAAPPYVLVGHSFGGWVAELYAARHLDEVAGLVLVDAPHPREWAEPDEGRKLRARRGARLARLGATTARLGVFRGLLLAFAVTAGRREAGERRRVFSLIDRTPRAIRAPLRTFWVRARTLDALASQIEHASESAATLMRERRALGALPLAVLTAADPTPERLEDQRATAAALSSRSEHVVAKASGHWIPLEEPALVVDAVRRTIERRKEGLRRAPADSARTS